MAPPQYRPRLAAPKRRMQYDRYRPYNFTDRDRRPPVSVLTDEDKSLPKNFAKPLTCFFWKQNGKCNKRDVDCAYAHWETGYLAAAPVSLPALQGLESIAGKHAETRLFDIRHSKPALSEIEIEDREAALRILEEELKKKAKELQQWEDELEQKFGAHRHSNGEERMYSETGVGSSPCIVEL